MTKKQFRKILDELVDGLPEEVARELDNVVFLADDGEVDGPLGEYIGLPRIDRIGDNTGTLPDRIFLYQNAIEDEVGDDPDTIREEMRRTLMHEIGHHFGWEDDELEHQEIQRGWRT